MRSLSRRLAKAIAVPALVSVLGSCGGDSVGPSTPEVREIAAYPNPATVRVDETLVMVLTIAADSGADQDIVWTSADPRRVSVTETGILKGISVGTAIVTAASVSNPSAMAIIPVNVIPAYTGVHRVTAAPQSVTVIPGQTQVLSVTVEADSKVSRDVRFVSDSPSVATVSATGMVTGVAPGSARITARSVADSNMTTVIGVTVRPPTPARVSVQSITSRGTGVPVDLQNVTGQADVSVNVEQGEGLLERIDLVVRNNNRDTVVASQSFGAALTSASSMSFDASMTGTIVMSFRTDAYNPTTGTVAFRNGATSIKVIAVTTASGAQSQQASSSVVALLNNVDGFLVTARGLSSTGTATALDANGRRWMQAGRGIVFTSIPVSFSGRAMGSRTISFPGAAPASAITSAKQGTAVDTLLLPPFYSTTNIGDGYLVGELPSVVASDSVGNALNLVPAAASVAGRGGAGILNAQATFLNGSRLEGMRVDNAPPPAATFVISSAQQNNANNWINASYVFATGLTGISTDGGVGLPGSAAAPTAESAGIVIAVTGNGLTDTTQVTTGADLPASSTNGAYTAVARYTDRLGNMRIVPLSGAGAHPRSTFGVDIVPPTIRYASGALASETLVSIGADSAFASPTGVVGPRAFAIDAIDDRSGLTDSRVSISLSRLAQPNPAGAFTGTSTCLIGAGSACAPVPALFESVLADQYRQHTTVMDNGSGVEGYYTFTATVQDQAGNTSTTITRRALLDAGTGVSAPQLTGLGVSGVLMGGQSAAFLALAVDNVELARGGVLLEYPNLPGGTQMFAYATPQTGGTQIGTAFDAALTSPVAGAHAAFTIPSFIRGLEIVSATDAPQAYPATTAKPTSANAWVRDFSPGSATATLAANIAIAPASVQSPGAMPGFLALAGTANEVQQWRRVPTAGPLRIESVGPSGQTNSPFVRVLLVRLEPSGLAVNPNVWRVVSELATPIGTDNGLRRAWTYDFGSQPSGSYVAIGVTAAGDGLATRLIAF